MKKIYRTIGLLSLSLLIAGGLQAQDWGVTADQKAQKLGVAFTDENIEAGEALFKSKSCSACHSEMSSIPENKRALPLAPNLGALNIQKANTDGEFFWKIHNGKGGMPPFKQLSEDERWKIVAYLRSFYPDYQPPAGNGNSSAAPVEKFKGKITALKLEFDKKSKNAVVKVDATDDEGNAVAGKNVKVEVMLKRSFGSLTVGNAKTGDNGLALVAIPEDIPADTNGIITLMATAKGYGDTVMVDAEYGEKLVWHNPLDENHLWGVSAKAPLWLKITYLSVVIGVWLTILWAVFQLARIYSLRER